MFKRSLKLKFAFTELIILIVVGGLYFGITELFEFSFEKYLVYVAMVVFFVATLLLIQISIYNPLKTVLREMKLLLTGKKFHKIFSKRIDEIGILAHFFNELTNSLGTIGKKLEEHQRFTTEVNLAQKIQGDLLPKEAPPIPYLDITTKTKPAAEIGGDSYDYLPQKDHTYLYLGDVTGHGIPAGLIMIMVDTLITSFAEVAPNSQELLVNVNKQLKPRIQPNMFMTMLLMRWHHEEKKMYYAGAGHEYLIHYHAETGKCENIKGGGIAIGMLPDVSKMIKEKSVDLKEGDMIVLYSDGITEGRNSNGEEYGLDRLTAAIEKYAGPKVASAEVFEGIAKEVTLFVEGTIQADDMSLMVVRHTGEEKVETKDADWEEKEGAESLIKVKKEDIKDTGLAS